MRLRRTLTTLTVVALTTLTLGVSSAARAATTSAAGSAPSVSGRTAQTEAQASAQARATGKAVPVEAATTPTDQLTANADGTFTLVQAVAPVRKRISGSWKPLNANLVRKSDGSISPATTTSGLTLSGGGSGPLATMKTANRSLALTLSLALPAPTLSKTSATYTNVLAGVDLKVTADLQGGFSEVLIVKDAAAAANPALKSLKFTTLTRGVTLGTDTAGNITAKDPAGTILFAAPAPIMWDSGTTATSSRPASAGAGFVATPQDTGGGAPTNSTSAGPGVAARTAPIKVAYGAGAITLTPDSALLTGSSTVFPLYIDPTYSAGGGVLQAWTYVNSHYSDTSFWKTTDAVGLRVGYQGWDSPYYTGRSFAQMSVTSSLYGATIEDSHFYATETYAPSCTEEPVQLWLTDRISSSTTWDNQPAWDSVLDTKTAAHGWSSDCPTASVGFTTKSAMQSAANGSWPNITLGLRATDESDRYGWKKFDHAAMYMSTTYDHRPNKPSSQHTSPATNCTGAITTVGNGDVVLYAGVSDPDGGPLSATFKAWETNSSTVTVAIGTISATSGTTPSLYIRKATLAAKAGASILKISWNVSVSDDVLAAASPSTTCTFNFDPTVPGPPSVTDAGGYSCDDSASTVTYTVGRSTGFTITRSSTGSAPSSYLYQLNGAAPLSTTTTTLSIKPTRGTNILTVTALSAGGNIGDTAVCVINASAAATAADGDLNGDGIADLIVVGKQTGLPAGLWLAQGQAGNSHSQGNGDILAAGSDIGAQGTSVGTHGAPADWTGTQAFTGHFASGAGFNDVFDYNPSTGDAHILYGSGDGSALSPTSGNETNVPSNVFEDLQTSTPATHVANGGSLYNTVNGNPVTGFPDLLLTLEGHLLLEPAVPTPGGYAGIDSAMDLSDINPTGIGDWSGWTISTSLVNGLPAMYARSDADSLLYYYSPAELQNLALGNASNPRFLDDLGYSTADAPVIQAADINTNGAPDLWVVDPSGSVGARYFDGFDGNVLDHSFAADSHVWALTDATNGIATTAADSAGTALPLTGSGTGARWDDGDLFDPHLNLNGTSAGVMTANAALSVSANFTLSVWAKPTTTGGVILSQEGTKTSGFTLYPDTNSKKWNFCLEGSDSLSPVWDCALGGAVHLGAWNHLTATYNAATKRMALYTDGIETAWNSHTAVAGFTGHLNVGQQMYQGIHQSFFNGSLSNIEVWAGTTLSPDQVAALSGTPGYVVFPSDGTNYVSGTTWTTTGAKMTFIGGQLTITETGSCTSNCTWTQSSAGHANAVLTLQDDGDLVIYPQAEHTTGTEMWDSGTVDYTNQPGVTMFLQPDGNLVIYDFDGTVLWASNTHN